MNAYCPKCGAERIGIAHYCGDCGTELVITYKYKCLNCGHHSNYYYKFCTFCGSPLFVPTGDEELSKVEGER